MLFVEGLTDVTILQLAIDLFQPELNEIILIKSEHDAGYNWVKDHVMAWVCSRKSSRVGGLFDGDFDAKNAKQELDTFLKGRRDPNAKTFLLNNKFLPSHIRPIFQKGIKIPVALEEMFSPSIWNYANEEGWLEERDDIISYNKFRILNKSFQEYCQEKGLDKQEQLYVLKKVKCYKKEKLANYVLQLETNELVTALGGFKSLVEELTSFFRQ